MNSGNLSLQHGIDETVPSKHGLAFELGGNDHGLERLSAAAYTSEKYAISQFVHLKLVSPARNHTRKILNLNILGLQLFHQLALQRVRRDTRGVGHGGVDCGKRARREGEWSARRDGRAEEIATASAQDSWGESAGEHQARWWGGRQEDGSDFATGGVRLQIAPAPARAAPSCDFLDLRFTVCDP